MQMAVPVFVYLWTVLGNKAVALVGLGLVVFGFGTVVVNYGGRSFVVLVPTSVRVYYLRAKAWLLVDDDGMMQALQDLIDAFGYLGAVALVFMFYGFLALTFMQALNITDISSLPIFGSVINEIVKALGTGASIIVVAFLMIIFIPVIVVITKMGKRTATVTRD